MRRIYCDLLPASTGRNIAAGYDSGSGALYGLTSPLVPVPFGVNLDGTLVLDLDENHVLVGFDCCMRRELWKPAVVPSGEWTRSFDLRLTVDKPKESSPNVEIFANENGSEVLIDFSEGEAHKWVGVSESISAGVGLGCLLALMLRIPPGDLRRFAEGLHIVGPYLKTVSRSQE